MTYGSAIVPQTGHWLLSAAPLRQAIALCPCGISGQDLADRKPVNIASQNAFLVSINHKSGSRPAPGINSRRASIRACGNPAGNYCCTAALLPTIPSPKRSGAVKVSPGFAALPSIRKTCVALRFIVGSPGAVADGGQVSVNTAIFFIPPTS